MTVAYKPGERVVVVPEMSGDGWVWVGKFVRVSCKSFDGWINAGYVEDEISETFKGRNKSFDTK